MGIRALFFYMVPATDGMGSPSERLKTCVICVYVKLLPPCSADAALLPWQDRCLCWDN